MVDFDLQIRGTNVAEAVRLAAHSLRSAARDPVRLGEIEQAAVDRVCPVPPERPDLGRGGLTGKWSSTHRRPVSSSGSAASVNTTVHKKVAGGVQASEDALGAVGR